jgi:hypothetical protein
MISISSDTASSHAVVSSHAVIRSGTVCTTGAVPCLVCLQLSGESAAARELLALSEVINQAVGDAISGILLVEAALRRRQWGLAEWAALYTDLPSRQTKVSWGGREGE